MANRPWVNMGGFCPSLFFSPSLSLAAVLYAAFMLNMVSCGHEKRRPLVWKPSDSMRRNLALRRHINICAVRRCLIMSLRPLGFFPLAKPICSGWPALQPAAAAGIGDTGLFPIGFTFWLTHPAASSVLPGF